MASKVLIAALCLHFLGCFRAHAIALSVVSDKGTRTFTRTEVKRASVRSRYQRDLIDKRDVSLCVNDVSSAELLKLQSNTHKNPFKKDDGTSITLAWIGDGTGIILALTIFDLPYNIWYFEGSSRLYRSTNYGKSFTEISDVINNTFIRKDFGIMAGPGDTTRVILAADVSAGTEQGGKIFTSTDSGESFSAVNLPFHPAMKIVYHPTNQDYLLTKSIDNVLWLSSDFGKNWNKVHEFVYTASWGPGNTIFFTTHPNGTVDINEKGVLHLKKTVDFGKTFHIISDNVFNFGFGGHFLFASVVKVQGQPRKVYVSVDEGESWNEAQLPPVTHEQFYSVLASDDEMIFMHVDEPGDHGFGTVYTSDDTGALYSKSLERHWFDDTRGFNDFTNVSSLRGVYITNILDKDGNIRSVITFDAGGAWKQLKQPSNSHCNLPDGDASTCNLHIYGEYSISQFSAVPVPPVMDANAVGLIIAHGHVGKAITNANPDVYVSDDGGYTWIKSLKGPHHYALLDSGGLIVAVEANSEKSIHTVKFSTDEGQCWKQYNFTNEQFIFSGLASEPGTKSMNISIWGYTMEEDSSTTWVSFTIDFEELLTRDCQDDDYVEWLAHSTDTGNETDGCILGYKEIFRRLKKSSVCKNGRDYIVEREQKPCPCTKNDYLCDFGYYRLENSSDCERQTDLKDNDLEFCLQGKEEQLITDGYRKIPGNKCEGGFKPYRTEELKTLCAKMLSSADPQYSTVALITISVLVMSAALFVGLILIFKKYVCGNRTLIYRYSALQQNADDRCIVDELDGVSSDTRRTYHDDSDEDLIE